MTDAPPTLDLDGLSLLVRDAVSLPWKWVQHEVDPERPQWSIHPGILIADETDGTPGGDEYDKANAAYLIAAVNALPALIAEVRRLREEVEAAEAQRDEAREALRPFARAGSIAGERDPRWDFYAYRPAAGDEYAIMGDHLRKAHQVIEGQRP